MDRIVFWQENCASVPVSFDHVSYSVFRIARDLFYWELIFCVLCYSYSEIGINGIVPKEHALINISSNLHMVYEMQQRYNVYCRWHVFASSILVWILTFFSHRWQLAPKNLLTMVTFH